MRPINKRGAIIFEDSVRVRVLLDNGLRSPSAEGFVLAAAMWEAELAVAVHSGVDPGADAEDMSRTFMRFARMNFSEAALGKAIRMSGMSVEQARAEMCGGRWDPFADAEVLDSERLSQILGTGKPEGAAPNSKDGDEDDASPGTEHGPRTHPPTRNDVRDASPGTEGRTRTHPPTWNDIRDAS